MTIGNQRSDEDDMGVSSWCNSLRISKRIAQSPPNPNFEGMMNFNLLFALRNCDDATKVEVISLLQSMVEKMQKFNATACDTDNEK